MKELFSILRIHIVSIAVGGALVFGWLLTGRYLWWIALIGGFDWLLINLANRVSDLREDLANAIPGSERIARRKTGTMIAWAALLAGSLAITVPLFPELTGWRLFMQAVGLVYSFRIIPHPGGRRRLKNVYLLKNLLSGLGFVTSCFLYPLAHAGFAAQIAWPGIVALMLYFVPFEQSYEILYDLRDLDGDRRAGVPTYPLVHGVATTHTIIHALLLASLAIVLLGFVLGFYGVKETLMGFGPVLQFFLLRPILRRGPTTADCIVVTFLGTAMLLAYLACTALWLAAGLPENIYL
ncbi:MAG TPA: UbiA family prenyltransferase [bacterium]|nr:UbiA family prenyltransferase [bacterium]